MEEPMSAATPGIVTFVVYCLTLGAAVMACGDPGAEFMPDTVDSETARYGYSTAPLIDPPYMTDRPKLDPVAITEPVPVDAPAVAVELVEPVSGRDVVALEPVITFEPLAEPEPATAIAWPRFRRLLPIPIGACDHIPAQGACVGDVFEECVDGVPVGMDCASIADEPETCGFDSETQQLGCVSHGAVLLQRAVGTVVPREQLENVMPVTWGEPWSHVDPACLEAGRDCDLPFADYEMDGSALEGPMAVAHHESRSLLAMAEPRYNDDGCLIGVEGTIVRVGSKRVVAHAPLLTSSRNCEDDADQNIAQDYWRWIAALHAEGYTNPANLLTHMAEGDGDGATITTPLVVLDAPYKGHMIALRPSGDDAVIWWVWPDNKRKARLGRVSLATECFGDDDETIVPEEDWCRSESASLENVHLIGKGRYVLLKGRTDGYSCHDPGAEWQMILPLPKGL